jgi:Vitamin B6 photo-protection and homoeostasis
VTLLLLLSLHLGTNYMAVRAVRMTTLNRQRANIVLSALLDSDPDLDLSQLGPFLDPAKSRTAGKASTAPQPEHALEALRPEEVSRLERIFERDGTLRWTVSRRRPLISSPALGSCQIGVSLQDLIIAMKGSRISSATTSMTVPTPSIFRHAITHTFASEAHLLFLSFSFLSPLAVLTSRRTLRASIVLKRGCTPTQQLKAWAHALLAARMLSCTSSDTTRQPAATTTATTAILSFPRDGNPIAAEQQRILTTITHTLAFLNWDNRFETLYLPALLDAGWNLGVDALETRPERRRVDVSL